MGLNKTISIISLGLQNFYSMVLEGYQKDGDEFLKSLPKDMVDKFVTLDKYKKAIHADLDNCEDASQRIKWANKLDDAINYCFNLVEEKDKDIAYSRLICLMSVLDEYGVNTKTEIQVRIFGDLFA